MQGRPSSSSYCGLAQNSRPSRKLKLPFDLALSGMIWEYNSDHFHGRGA